MLNAMLRSVPLVDRGTTGMGHRRFHDKYFDRGLKGWIVKTARKHYWRVAAWYDLEDLTQDGLLAYAICRQRYRHKVKNRRHFMALVQVVFTNRITDLANERRAGEELPVSQFCMPGKELACLEYLGGGQEGEAELRALLASAPAEIRKFFELLDSPEGIAKIEMPLRRRKDGTRETTEEHLGWLLGKPIEDLEATITNLLYPPDTMKQWAAFFASVLLEGEAA